MQNLTSNLQISAILAPHHSSTFLQDIVGIVEPEPFFSCCFLTNVASIFDLHHFTKVSTLPSSPWWFYAPKVPCPKLLRTGPQSSCWHLAKLLPKFCPTKRVEIQKVTSIQWWLSIRGTNISATKALLKMICFAFPRCDMLVPWRVVHMHYNLPFQSCFKSCFSLTRHSPSANVCSECWLQASRRLSKTPQRFWNYQPRHKRGCYTLQIAFPASSSESTKHRMQGTCTWWGNNTSSFQYFVMRPTPRRRWVPWAPRYPSHVHWAARTKVPEKPPGCITKLGMVIPTQESLQNLYMYALATYL